MLVLVEDRDREGRGKGRATYFRSFLSFYR